MCVTGDIGNTITCTVTATNTGGSTNQISNTTATVISNLAAPVNTVAPVVSASGPPYYVGTVFSTTDGTWTNTPTSYAYQWKVNGSNVGTNTNSYTCVEADVTLDVTCVVTATNAAGSTGQVSNALTISAKSVPTFVAAGTRGTGVGATTPTIPAGSTTNDIMLLIVETSNNTVSAPAGWTNVTNSPQGSGTSDAIGAIGVYILETSHRHGKQSNRCRSWRTY